MSSTWITAQKEMVITLIVLSGCVLVIPGSSIASVKLLWV